MTVHTLQPWRTRAACRGPETALFFPPSSSERREDRDVRESRAKAICRQCPVRSECLDHALRVGRVARDLGRSERARTPRVARGELRLIASRGSSRGPAILTSPRRRVKPSRSNRSSSGTTYFRELPSSARASPTVIVPPSTSAARRSARARPIASLVNTMPSTSTSAPSRTSARGERAHRPAPVARTAWRRARPAGRARRRSPPRSPRARRVHHPACRRRACPTLERGAHLLASVGAAWRRAHRARARVTARRPRDARAPRRGRAAQCFDVGGKRPPLADDDRVTALDGVAHQRIDDRVASRPTSRARSVAPQPPVPLEQADDGGPGQHRRGATAAGTTTPRRAPPRPRSCASAPGRAARCGRRPRAAAGTSNRRRANRRSSSSTRARAPCSPEPTAAWSCAGSRDGAPGMGATATSTSVASNHWPVAHQRIPARRTPDARSRRG